MAYYPGFAPAKHVNIICLSHFPFIDSLRDTEPGYGEYCQGAK
jgi:hypothetical protein